MYRNLGPEPTRDPIRILTDPIRPNPTHNWTDRNRVGWGRTRCSSMVHTDEWFVLNVNESNILQYSMTELQYSQQGQHCGVEYLNDVIENHPEFGNILPSKSAMCRRARAAFSTTSSQQIWCKRPIKTGRLNGARNPRLYVAGSGQWVDCQKIWWS